jgi:hypothetical protein
MAGGVEFQFAQAQPALLVGAGGAAQHRLDAGDEFRWREGLGDVVVGAGFEATHLLFLFGEGGEHDHGNVAQRFVAAQAAQQVDAALVGQHPVQQDEVGAPLAQPVLRLAAVPRVDHLHPRPGEGEAHQVADGGLVFDEEDGRHR